MKDFRYNGAIVISTLERYRYGPRAISLSQDCYDSLYGFMVNSNSERYSRDAALNWCENNVAKYIRSAYTMAIYRLDDVYNSGKVLGSHLIVYPDPSETFSENIETYLSEITSSGTYTKNHLVNIRHAVTQFCCFAQYNGANDMGDIGYDMLDMYDQFLRESSKAYYINEGLVCVFLGYMADKGMCRTGYPIYMHYIQSGKCTSLSNLSPVSQGIVNGCREKNGDFSADTFYKSIDHFVERLKAFGYSKTVTDSAHYHLTLLYLFLDKENIGYERTAVEAWFGDVGEHLFGKGLCMARRTYEMYDDYTRERDILPLHWWKHRNNRYDNLPVWCKEMLALFIATKEKEGWAKNTVKMYSNCCTAFCCFLVSSGITSFSEISPQVIKDFNLCDNGHKTPEAKNAYNSRIRKFLIFFEINGIIPMGMHLALPSRAAGGEKIIDVLSTEDMDAIDSYCKNTVDPLELRDAAILMIAMNTGFRSCDIVGIRLSDIDWKNRIIRIVQKKTKVEHLHPMDVRTGNAIYKYIKDGRRRNTGSDMLFLTTKAPYGPVGCSACRKAMERAGASTGRIHLARKTFGSAILNNGATIVETAEMLGHSDCSSVHKYTSLDAERMRLCPLSLAETNLSIGRRYRHG